MCYAPGAVELTTGFITGGIERGFNCHLEYNGGSSAGIWREGLEPTTEFTQNHENGGRRHYKRKMLDGTGDSPVKIIV